MQNHNRKVPQLMISQARLLTSMVATTALVMLVLACKDGAGPLPITPEVKTTFEGGFNLAEFLGVDNPASSERGSASSNAKSDGPSTVDDTSTTPQASNNAKSDGPSTVDDTSTTPQASNPSEPGDEGTRISGEVRGEISCVDSTGLMALQGTVTTTGSVDSVELVAFIDHGGGTPVGQIPPQAFAHDGRVKTANFTADLLLANGEHSVSLCLTQSGARGREEKSACTQTWSVVADCVVQPPPTPDTAPPVTVATVSREPNNAGWHNSSVTIAFESRDDDSGVAQIQVVVFGPHQTSTVFTGSTGTIELTTDGLHNVAYYAVDVAGNAEAPRTLTIKLDATPPQVLAARTPLPNSAGWNNEPVSVSFTATDALSGLAGPTGGTTNLAEEGTDQSAQFVAEDIAGNRTISSVSGINIDMSAPSFAGIPDSCILWPPNHKMIEAAQVNGEDALSGTADLTLTASSSEDDDGVGDGATSGDTAIDGGTVWLRAERSGRGTGRTYSISAWTIDLAGNTADATFACVVPHDQSKTNSTPEIAAVATDAATQSNGGPQATKSTADALPQSNAGSQTKKDRK